MPHELQHSAAGRKQVRVRRTSGLSGRALKQQVELIAWGALIAMQAKPVAFHGLRHQDKLLRASKGMSSTDLPFSPAQSKRALEEARDAVAALICATRASEVAFTACGTESNNWALAGAALAWRERHQGGTPHVVASAVEHPAVTECLKALAGLVRSRPAACLRASAGVQMSLHACLGTPVKAPACPVVFLAHCGPPRLNSFTHVRQCVRGEQSRENLALQW